MASLYDLLISPDQETEAAALQDVLRKRGARGALLSATGNKNLAGLGQGMVRSADEGQAGMAEVGGQRLRNAFAAAQAKREQGNADRSYGLQREKFSLDRQAFGAEQSRKATDEAAKAAAAEAAKSAAALEDADKLRKEFQALPAYKDMQQVETSVKKIRGSSDTGAGDIALIFNYMKMLDPGSTVREGEFAQAASTGAVPDRVFYFYKRLEGDKLPPSARRELKAEAERVYGAQKVQFDETAAAYKGYAKVRGVAPEHVIFGSEPPAAPAGAAPAPSDPHASLRSKYGL